VRRFPTGATARSGATENKIYPEEVMKKLISALAAAAALMTAQLPAHSQSSNYPEAGKTVRLMVGFGAGGGTDIAARLLAQALETKLGGNFIVENFPGGGGLQAVNRLVAAKPDGYTLALVPLPATNMLYLDSERGGKFSLEDVVPVSMHDYGPVAIAVAASSRWQTLDDLLKEAREKPNTLTAASNGALAAGHLGLLRFNQAAGVKLRWTPVEQPGMLLSNVIGGHLDVITDTFSELYPAQQSKDLRILAVLADERQSEFPDVPTARDSKIDAVVTTNRVVIAPKGTPATVVEKLDGAIRAITADPAYQKEALQRKVQLRYLNSAQTTSLWKGFDETFAPLVKEFRAQR
jgi:tripartite-type tricarboxylate transporter receptor subunit TctC